MDFPYKLFKEYVKALINKKTFLLEENKDIDLSDLKSELELFENAIKNANNDSDEDEETEESKKSRAEKIKKLDENKRLILLHAYWLFYYPFGAESMGNTINNYFKFEDNPIAIDKKYLNVEKLASSGAFTSRLHQEVIWILGNVIKPIADGGINSYDDFKLFFINNWKNKQAVNYCSKNLILHILDNNDYEPIAKNDDKTSIVKAFSNLTNKIDVDEALKDIRDKLEMKGSSSFYDSQYNVYWKNDLESPSKKLEYKKALILYGPPGTSKTYTAIEIAKTLIVKAYLSSASLLEESIINNCKNYIKLGEDDVVFQNDEHISYLQFHINYNYSEVKTKLGFIFDIIEKAKNNPKMPYIVILDEINRTDISRVFGEMFTAIEKRGKDVTLTLPDPRYPEKRLCLNIPENIYFIGTMNEIDFSLERIDFALRRRFVWEYCGYNENTLKTIIKKRCNNINDKKIVNFVSSCNKLNGVVYNLLGKSYHIGHAFFAEIANIYKELRDSEETDKWNEAKKILWEISIKPTLEAYCGTMNKVEMEKYLNDKNNDSFYKAFFGQGKKD